MVVVELTFATGGKVSLAKVETCWLDVDDLLVSLAGDSLVSSWSSLSGDVDGDFHPSFIKVSEARAIARILTRINALRSTLGRGLDITECF